jgi:phosphoglucomutase
MEIVHDHWRTFGRDYYTRHDYEGIETAAAEALMANLRARLPELPGTTAAHMTVDRADDFAYRDPVDGSEARAQGVRIYFRGGARAVFRLSGTGTTGATLRVYLERYAPGPDGLDRDPQEALADVITEANAIAGIRARTGRTAPDVVT